MRYDRLQTINRRDGITRMATYWQVGVLSLFIMRRHSYMDCIVTPRDEQSGKEHNEYYILVDTVVFHIIRITKSII